MKTEIEILEEKLKQKEIDSFEDHLMVDKVNAIARLLDTVIPVDHEIKDVSISSPFNQAGIDILTSKAIELVRKF